MDYKDFFRFGSKLANTTFQAGPIDQVDERKLIQGNYEGIAFPVTFKQDYGKKLCDLLDTGFAGLYLVSEKLKDFFERNRFTGWKTYPIRLLDKKGNEIQGYYGLSIVGRCGPVNYSKCEIVEKRLVPNGPVGKYRIGLPIDLDKWDGADFFLPGESVGAIVTRKVSELIKDQKFSNVLLINLSKIERSSNEIK